METYCTIIELSILNLRARLRNIYIGSTLLPWGRIQKIEYNLRKYEYAIRKELDDMNFLRSPDKSLRLTIYFYRCLRRILPVNVLFCAEFYFLRAILFEIFRNLLSQTIYFSRYPVLDYVCVFSIERDNYLIFPPRKTTVTTLLGWKGNALLASKLR